MSSSPPRDCTTTGSGFWLVFHCTGGQMLDLSSDSKKQGGVRKENRAPVSNKESCRLKKNQDTSTLPLWLDLALQAGSCGLYCALQIFVANRVNGLIQSLSNWIENLQWTLSVLDQAQKKQVGTGQNVLGKIPLGVHICLTVANSM